MALAGYCDSCGENVWVTPSGACPRGHGADRISNVYETGTPGDMAPDLSRTPGYVPVAPEPVVGRPPGPRKKMSAGVVIAIIVAVLLGCAVVGIVSIVGLAGLPAFNAAQSGAQQRACFSNQRTIESAAQTYNADKEVMPESIDALVPSYLKTAPVCPSGGKYSFDSATGEVSCSVHGHY